MKHEKLDLPLMDVVQAMTFRNKVAGKNVSKEGRHVLAAYRSRLRQAQRFVLDDDAVRLVCHLSHEEDRLPGWSFLARLPFETMWLEFDLHVKVGEFARMDTLRHPFRPEEVSSRVGYLMYLDKDQRWIAHPFYLMSGDAVVPGIVTFLFDPEAVGDPVGGSATWKAPTLSRRAGFPGIPGTIKAEAGGIDVYTTIAPEFVLCGILEAGKDEVPIVSPEWLAARGAAILDPFWAAELAKRPPAEINQLIAAQVMEESGVIRWLVTALAAINGLPKRIAPIATRAGRHMVGMHALSYLSARTIELTIPRDDRMIWARRALDRNAGPLQRRWHEVIGHWRVIELGKLKGRLCRHEPVMVEGDLAMCERCQLMVRWIKNTARGDLALGVVDHAYHVRGKRHQPRIKLGAEA